MTKAIGLIGGSGFYSFDSAVKEILLETPFSEKPVALYQSESESLPVFFLPRHGVEHAIPPHQVNYRANLWALKEVGVDIILAANVVGGISESMAPGVLAIPDQIIDYTWGRDHTFFDTFLADGSEGVSVAESHVDFSWPYDQELRALLKETAESLGLKTLSGGTYGATQGPRLESAAEITRMKQDGCSLVGMTGMPEAALARELGIRYASLCLVVNWAAGLTSEEIAFAEIAKTLDHGVEEIRKVFDALVARLSNTH